MNASASFSGGWIVPLVAALFLAANAGACADNQRLLQNIRAIETAIQQAPAANKGVVARIVAEAASGLASEGVEDRLTPTVLIRMSVNPEMRVKVAAGSADRILVAEQWCPFLVEIRNDSGSTAQLQFESPNFAKSPGDRNAWLELKFEAHPNLPIMLSGDPLEYRLIWLRTKAVGDREARIQLHLGQGTQDLGFRSEVDLLFRCIRTE